MPTLSIPASPQSYKRELPTANVSGPLNHGDEIPGKSTRCQHQQLLTDSYGVLARSPSRLTTRKPSNSVTGGAIIGSLVGCTVLILLYIACCYRTEPRKSVGREHAAWNQSYARELTSRELARPPSSSSSAASAGPPAPSRFAASARPHANTLSLSLQRPSATVPQVSETAARGMTRPISAVEASQAQGPSQSRLMAHPSPTHPAPIISIPAQQNASPEIEVERNSSSGETPNGVIVKVNGVNIMAKKKATAKCESASCTTTSAVSFKE